jgi:transposase
MTQAKRKRYTKEFKQDAVTLVAREQYTIAEAARRLGVNENMLGRWKREFGEHGAVAFPGQGRQTPEQEEITSLRRDVKRLEMERDILKKATVFFASQKS